MESEKKKISIQATPGVIKPIFADEVMIGTGFKGKGKEKESIVRLAFVDTWRGQIIAEIAMFPSTAEALSKIISERIKDLKSGKVNKEKKSKPISTKDLDYIG